METDQSILCSMMTMTRLFIINFQIIIVIVIIVIIIIVIIIVYHQRRALIYPSHRRIRKGKLKDLIEKKNHGLQVGGLECGRGQVSLELGEERRIQFPTFQ